MGESEPSQRGVRCTPWLSVSPLQLPAQNPILKNITDYLIEEVNAEEEELLGGTGAEPEEALKDGNPAEISVERDEKLVKVSLRERLSRALLRFQTGRHVRLTFSLSVFASR